MRFTGESLHCGFRLGARRFHKRLWGWARTPHALPFPVVGKSIMLVMFNLVAAGNRLIEINAGTARDLLAGEIHIDVQRAPGRIAQSQWRDQNFSSRKDEASGDDDVTNGPFFV